MIQRKQTLFLLAAAVIALLMFFVPFQILTIGGLNHPITIVPGNEWIIETSNIYYPFILNILLIILALCCIFLYKNRVLQYKLSNLVALFNVFIIGVFFLMDFAISEAGTSISFSIGSFLPIIGAIFAFLAGHFIKKDELLVRSTNRIR